MTETKPNTVYIGRGQEVSEKRGLTVVRDRVTYTSKELPAGVYKVIQVLEGKPRNAIGIVPNNSFAKKLSLN